MKKVLLLVIFVAVAMFLGAHPASGVKLDYDKKAQILRVDFVHKVDSEKDHFIDQFEVKVNKDKAVVQYLNIQETKDGGSVQYKIIGLKTGDIINVNTVCNKGGKKAENITIR